MARVLAVDDNLDILDLVRRAAGMHGHQVLTVTSAADFMTAYPAFDPDVVILDVVMPGMDGIELVRWLADIHCKARVVIMSGDMSGPFRQMAGHLAKDNGLHEVRTLPKPFRISELMAAIEGSAVI